MSNQKKEKEKKEKKDPLFVYFIENHILSEPANLLLSKNYLEAGELQSVEQNKFEYNHNFKYTIYRFTIYTSKIGEKQKTIEIGIKLENSAGKIFENKIIVADYSRDCFVYDFKYLKKILK